MSKLAGLLPKLKGELVEVSVGDDYEDIVLSDTTKKVNGVIFGVLEDIVDDFMILNSLYVNKDGEIKTGNIVYINIFQIKIFTKIKSQGSLNDVLLSSAHSRRIKQLLGLNE